MSEVTFEELSVRLGYPYLYCHHGNCEHVIVFHDIRYQLFDKMGGEGKECHQCTKMDMGVCGR